MKEEFERKERKRKKPSKRSFGRSFECAYLSKANDVFPLQLPTGAYFDPSVKNIAFTLGSKEKKIRRQLEEKLAQSEKLAGIGTIASGIAHGINNPLAGIMGYAEIMMDEDDIEQMKKYAKKIVSEAERASEIINWISRYTRPTKDSKITDIDLNNVIDESLEALKLYRKSSEIKIEKYFKDVPIIKGNRSELQQIFVNLIDNALDAMKDSGKLGLTTTLNDRFVEVRVSDNGVGISKKNMRRIFEPFFSTKEVGKGIGLGLYVTSMIVKKHHGEMDVDSEMGKGTTFTIRFPISKESI